MSPELCLLDSSLARSDSVFPTKSILGELDRVSCLLSCLGCRAAYADIAASAWLWWCELDSRREYSDCGLWVVFCVLIFL